MLPVELGAKMRQKRLSTSLRNLRTSLKKLKRLSMSRRRMKSLLSQKKRKRLQLADAASIQQTIRVAIARLGLHQTGAMLAK